VRVARELVEVKLARQATQQKKKRGPSSRALFVFSNSRIKFGYWQNRALLRCRLVRGVLVFPAAFLRVMAFVMML
jgi:hypothetical protein